MNLSDTEKMNRLFTSNPDNFLRALSDQVTSLKMQAVNIDKEAEEAEDLLRSYKEKHLNKNGPLTKFVLCRYCAECDEPIPLDVCSELGYNPGVDGHLLNSHESAESARNWFLEDWNGDHPSRKMTTNDVGIYQITLTKVG